MRIRLFTLVLSVLSLCVYAEKSFTGWRLTPDAEAKLAEYSRAASNCRLKSNITQFVPRAQLKYTLSKNDYIHRWYDRPLYQNTGLARFDRKNVLVNDAEAKAIKQALELGKLSGMASLLETSGRSSFFKTGKDNGIRLHGEFTTTRFRRSQDYLHIAGMMLKYPNVYRLKGKPVISIYPMVYDTSYVKDLRKNLTAKYGNKFTLVPYVNFYNKHKFSKKVPLDAAAIEKMAEELRTHLRIADGIHVHGEHFLSNGRTDNSFGFKVMLPILHKIFSEAEFKDKFLSYGLIQGHENQYRWNYTRDSEGTATLRKELEFVMALRPDICLLPEWDEVNENTCYRPMVNTGWSSLRIMRHFSEKMRGEKFTAFPGDDLSIPNMILAYRRRMLAGETAEFQVTNIPDQTPQRDYKITLALADTKGNIIKRFAPKTLNSAKCDAVTFTVQVAELLAYQLVKPRLEISWDGGKYVSPDTFWAQELRADWNQDWQWAKHPLREQLSGVKASYTITPYENGLLRLKGRISSPVPLAQAEILDGSDTVWMADNSPALRENDTHAVIKLEVHGISRFNFNMTADIKNSPNAVMGNGKKLPQRFKDKKWNAQFAKVFLFRLPKTEVNDAIINVTIPGIFNENIPVKKIMDKHLIGFNSHHRNLTMVVSRYNSQITIPEHINKREVEFDCFVIPGDTKKSVFSLRVIDLRGNTWRGGEKSLYTPSGKEKTFNVYDKVAKKAVKITVDENLLTPMSFDFSPARGTVIANPAGRKFFGIMNACTPLASNIGIGGSRYGSLPFNSMADIKGAFPALPLRHRETDGSWSLTFDKLSHVSLPMQIVPMHAGHKITMKIFVDKHFKEEQYIFGSGSHGLMLSVVNGKLRARMFIIGKHSYTAGNSIVFADAKTKLVPGKWNDVEVSFDQQNFAVKLNGVSGKPVKVSGYHMRPKAGVLGAGESRKNYFKGKIKELSIGVL
ncbi:MAG: hypothetical protein IJY46_10310 [Lentisphaeria bacterium]|nr:hypothetical protein [Lentisphaeria bacterium]